MSDLPQRLRFNATIPLVMEAADRIEQLEAALREIAHFPVTNKNRAGTQMMKIAREALAPEQDK